MLSNGPLCNESDFPKRDFELFLVLFLVVVDIAKNQVFFYIFICCKFASHCNLEDRQLKTHFIVWYKVWIKKKGIIEKFTVLIWKDNIK